VSKAFAQCSLTDLAQEIFLASRTATPSALDDAAAALVLPAFSDERLARDVLMRHPQVQNASGLVCTGTAVSKQAWCSMLRDLFNVSGAAVSDAALLRVYLVCKESARRGRVRVNEANQDAMFKFCAPSHDGDASCPQKSLITKTKKALKCPPSLPPLFPSFLMSSGDVIFISGATGPFSSGINGPYDRTAESRGGYNVFAKRGDGSVCMEHHGGSWKVRHISDKGGAHALARVSGFCLLEDCASRVWSVLDMKCFVDQPVTIVSGADAVRQVTSAPPPALPWSNSVLRRLPNILQRSSVLWQRTMRALPPCSSPAPQEVMTKKPMDCLSRR
jgi:hypothetical protein